MQLTIIPVDGVVIYNNIRYENVDLSGVDSHIHAVQFQGNKGWIEYKDNTQTLLTSLTKFQAIINQCEAIKTFEEMRALDPYYGMSTEERLEAKRYAKMQEIQEAYIEAENSPYAMVDLTYAGGLESTRLVKEARDIMQELEREKAVTYDVNLQVIELPAASETEVDINDVIRSLALRTEAFMLKYVTLMRELNSAATEAQIEAIRW